MPIARIIVWAAIATVAVWAAVTYFVQPPGVHTPETRFLPWVLVALALVECPVGLWLEGRIARGQVSSSLSLTPAIRFRQAVMVSICLGLTPAIYGLVIYFLTADRSWFWPLAALSVLYLYFLLRRLEDLQRLAESGKEDGPSGDA